MSLMQYSGQRAAWGGGKVEVFENIAKLSIGGAVGVTEAAVPLVKDLMHGLRRKQ
jgi:hypothetical protein